jgi:hypothetical protein
MAPTVFQSGLDFNLRLFLQFRKFTPDDDNAAEVLISDNEHS